jgi:MFS family permease
MTLPRRQALTLYRWHDPPVVAVALLALAAGIGQFGVVAALGSVAKAFGHEAAGATITDQAGLSGTELGIGLAVIRLASLGSLPLAGLADRWGRRPLILWTCGVGLAFTVAASLSPTYWAFVAIFACGRPLLSTTNGVAQVMAAEHTPAAERAKAVALIAAAYAVGAGALTILHALAGGVLGFRGVFAVSLIPLLALPWIARRVHEPARFDVAARGPVHEPPVLGPVGHSHRRRLVVVCVLAFVLSMVSGPANSFVFLYAQNVEKLSGGVVSAMVVMAGIAGLGGLLAGRWLADHLGRRGTTALTMVCLVCFGILAYSGPKTALVIGYVLGVLSAATFAPAGGSLMNELFPTSVRASVTGWEIAVGVLGAVAGLLIFGAVADVGNRFALGSLAAFLPVLPVTLVIWLVPETMGREPEQLWPE